MAGSRLHQTITRIDPSFDFRSMGYRTFTQFLEASPVVKVTRARGSDDISISLKPTGIARLPGIGKVLAGKSRSQQSTATAAPAAEPVQAAPPPPAPVRTPAPSRPRPVRSTPRPSVAAPQPAPVVQRPAPVPVTAAPEPPSLPAASANGGWESEIHERWSQRVDKSTGVLNGTRAAGEAARILGATKLSASRFKTLQKLLASSPYLSARWEREGNSLHDKANAAAAVTADSR